jgi:hypothetical protein
VNRYMTISLAMLGTLVGLALPMTGCQDCSDTQLEGTYVILDYDDVANPTLDWVEGSGRVEVDQTTIVISYGTPDGSRWEVEFERTQTHLPE